MELHNEDIGTKKYLVLYRIQTAKDNLRSAKILLKAEEYKSANNLHIMRFFMLSMQYMQ